MTKGIKKRTIRSALEKSILVLKGKEPGIDVAVLSDLV